MAARLAAFVDRDGTIIEDAAIHPTLHRCGCWWE
jgi:histidinol phosphatase-like enzyme